jgi:hypothetical protein
MADHVLVHRDVLARLLTKSWEMFVGLAEMSQYPEINLESDSELVILAVQAGLLIPGPMAPGHVPPPPPGRRFQGGTPLAATYRAPGDERLRCEVCAKVVFPTENHAAAAARNIAARRPMRYYLGPTCGHWHVTRRKS